MSSGVKCCAVSYSVKPFSYFAFSQEAGEGEVCGDKQAIQTNDKDILLRTN